MLGDILGLRAGETGIELTLPRFLEPLGRSCGVFLVPRPDPASNCGLWVADAGTGSLVSDGEGSGARAGVLEALASWDDCVGVGQLGDVTPGWEKFADSGSSNVSICSVSTVAGAPAPAPAVRGLGELSFINDAGVAGEAIPGRGGCRVVGTPLFCGAMYGDGLAERGLGSGGGGISTGGASFRASGDTEPSSESVATVVEEEEVCIMGLGNC